MPNILHDNSMMQNHSTLSRITEGMRNQSISSSGSATSYRRLKNALAKIHLLPKKPISNDDDHSIDLINNHHYADNLSNSTKIDFPENVLKVYRYDPFLFRFMN